MSYHYKGYNPANSKHVQKYNASHYKQVNVSFKLSDYETIKACAESQGLTVTAFVKKAVMDAVEKSF